jgi:hypothetical protein
VTTSPARVAGPLQLQLFRAVHYSPDVAPGNGRRHPRATCPVGLHRAGRTRAPISSPRAPTAGAVVDRRRERLRQAATDQAAATEGLAVESHAPGLDDVMAAARAGLLLPRKATSVAPKPRTGLLMLGDAVAPH